MKAQWIRDTGKYRTRIELLALDPKIEPLMHGGINGAVTNYSAIYQSIGEVNLDNGGAVIRIDPEEKVQFRFDIGIENSIDSFLARVYFRDSVSGNDRWIEEFVSVPDSLEER